MIAVEWEDVWAAILARWDLVGKERLEGRKQAWNESFGGERKGVMLDAIRALEKQTDRFPSMKAMHEAVDVVKHHVQIHTGQPGGKPLVEEPPMSARERRLAALELRRCVDRRCEEGRGKVDDAMSNWLYQLAELYDENAKRSERGEPILGATVKGGWRPPFGASIGGPYGKLLDEMLSDEWRPPNTDPNRLKHIPYEFRNP